MKAFGKDILRTIQKEKKRLIALAIITTLGVTMMTGLKAACDDLRRSADNFFDAQNLHDLTVVSTLGLTEEDVEALQGIEDVFQAEGCYSETVQLDAGDGYVSAVVKTFTKNGVDVPYVTEGRLPEQANEIAVPEGYLEETGKSIGDTVLLVEAVEEDETANFPKTQYTIVGTVIDVTNVVNPDGATSFRSTGSDDYPCFVVPEAVDSDYYTAVNLVLAGTGVKNCFSEEYDELVNAGKSAIEQQVMTEREEARYNQILGDAQEELDAAQQEMEDALSDAEEELADARQKLDDGWLTLDQAEAELDAMEAVSPVPLDEARQELEESKQELEDGEQEYADGLAQYQEEKAEAEEKIEDARSKLSDISECEWYIRDRSALDGFSAISSDADCIESIGTVFPIMFLLVAILISLTTISRMVEEHRSLIGTYQALGFSNREIYQKFIVYSSVASLLGGMVGNFGGYIILPEIVIVIFRTMYQLPTYYIGYDFLFGIGGIALFYIAIVGTTIWCCRSTVRQKPSTLMRPKAPKAGSRILLEYIPPLWRRLSFLNKVTARNLFRYKKRFLMTVFGIAGCTALLLCGFSIKDTVADLLPRQYEQVISYDVLAVTAGGEDFQVMEEYLKEETEQLASSLPMEITTVDVKNESGDTLSVQLYVIPEGGNLTDFLTLETTEGESVDIRADGCYLTENIGTMLGISTGASVTLQDMSLKEANGTVNGMLQYYLGNAIFMTESYYEAIFGEYEPNAMVLCLAEDSDEADFVRQLKQREEILSVTSVQELKDGFSQSFALMNMVVYVIIVLAGALAFVVLFTLSTTNISERERELATIKVLGFFDREVHWYVNKETVILTVIGILVGLPLGVLLSNLLGVVLRIPAVVYSTTIHKVSYVLAGGMALLFALLVDTTTNRVLNRIHPVEALKSVE